MAFKIQFAGMDELSKQPSLGTEIVLFLAQSYASLENHTKAADMLRKVPAQKPDPEPEKGKEKDPDYLKKLKPTVFLPSRLLHDQERRSFPYR